MPGHDGNLGAKRAREARAALGLAPEEPFPCVLTAIERDAGVPVIVAALPDEIAGFCLWPGDGSSCLFVNGLQYVGRQRFTLAHEYGHHVHAPRGRAAGLDAHRHPGLRTRRPSKCRPTRSPPSSLAPAAAVRELVDGEPTLETLARLAGHFGISHAGGARPPQQPRAHASRRRAARASSPTPSCGAGSARASAPTSSPGSSAGSRASRALLDDSLLHAALRGDAAASPALSRALSLLMR